MTLLIICRTLRLLPARERKFVRHSFRFSALFHDTFCQLTCVPSCVTISLFLRATLFCGFVAWLQTCLRHKFSESLTREISASSPARFSGVIELRFFLRCSCRVISDAHSDLRDVALFWQPHVGAREHWDVLPGRMLDGCTEQVRWAVVFVAFLCKRARHDLCLCCCCRSHVKPLKRD